MGKTLIFYYLKQVVALHRNRNIYDALSSAAHVDRAGE